MMKEHLRTMAVTAKYTAQMAFLGTPETSAKVVEISELRGISKAHVIRELVEANVDAALASARGETVEVEEPTKPTRVRAPRSSAKKAS